jgi:thiol:disulfide interchange protein DsbA
VIRALILALLLAIPPGASAAAVPGLDYEVLQNPQPSSTDKIEVIEFFWYRCPHCFHLEPLLAEWLKQLPADVRFRRAPAIFNEDWAVDARLYYALEAIGQLERLHRPLFDAIDAEGARRMSTRSYVNWIFGWLARQGVDMAAYRQAFDSPAVGREIANARELTRKYRVEGTPTFAVQGRYIVGASVYEQRRLLEVTTELVTQARGRARPSP